MNDLDALPFPACDPWQHGLLPVSPVHSLYYEQCGRLDGQPVLMLHGGPGSGCNPGQRRFFDPTHYRAILFDQRGCNRSTPLGEVTDNTLADLVADIERLRCHLGIERWLVFGGSWGSTLALAYAQAHPDSVSGLILRGIFLCRQQELDWFLYGARAFFPEAWEQLTADVPAEARPRLLEWFTQQVFSADQTRALQAATRWNQYEASILSLLPGPPPSAPPDPALTLGRARVQLHYLSHAGFLAARPLLDHVAAIRHIPATIIQGRYDMVCPPCTAHELRLAWPEADYLMVADAGHASMEPGTAAALLAALDRFKQRY